LKSSRFMNAVNFYLNDQPHIDEWALAMDEVLGRKVVDTARNELIRGLREEILARLNSSPVRVSSPTMTTCLADLREALQQRRISIARIAINGRKLAESSAEALLKEQGVERPKGRLADLIGELRRRKQIAPWILSYLDCLRAFGNEGAHLSDDA